ncbi:MAG: hypothetical protein HYW89_04820 [Candidatus Sungiibacteriota bacterium]|uniref:Peptidylprolyl isomerase n=1 Tax=Candidatus Sungiibacteriota bacterium TaxID=2750080 RepID=A0A7T5UPW1_9BACT|nr:MAG: hypothetical protein HYW89_04820 [Candidatus Sungbacteria bacterium]
MKRWSVIVGLLAILGTAVVPNALAAETGIRILPTYVDEVITSECNLRELVQKLDFVLEKRKDGNDTWYELVSRRLTSKNSEPSNYFRIELKNCMLQSAQKKTTYFHERGQQIKKEVTYKFILFYENMIFDVDRNEDGSINTLPVIEVTASITLLWRVDNLEDQLFHTLGPVTLEGGVEIASKGRGEYGSYSRLYPKRPSDIFYLEILISPNAINGQRLRD